MTAYLELDVREARLLIEALRLVEPDEMTEALLEELEDIVERLE